MRRLMLRLLLPAVLYRLVPCAATERWLLSDLAAEADAPELPFVCLGIRSVRGAGAGQA